LHQDSRPRPTQIYPVKQIAAELIDRIVKVYPGNHIQLNEITQKGSYSIIKITINLEGITPMIFSLIGKQFKNLPLVLSTINVTYNNGQLTGPITLEGLGS